MYIYNPKTQTTMTKEQEEKLEEVYNSLPDAPGAIQPTFKCINKEVLFSIVGHMVATMLYEAKLESLNEFKTIVHETFN
jgi:hypothetical protein